MNLKTINFTIFFIIVKVTGYNWYIIKVKLSNGDESTLCE